MLLSKTAQVKWNSKNKSYYCSLGYPFSNMGNSFEVNIEHLPSQSKVKVLIKCDYQGENCQNIITKTFGEYNRQKTIKETGEMRINNKDCCSACRWLKAKERNIEKFHGISPLSTEEGKNKYKNTVMTKYGVDHVMKNEEIKKKVTNTYLLRYGVDHISKSIVIKEKKAKTMYKNGTAPCSRQQTYLFKIFGGELNYPVSNCFLDIAFPKEMIYIEYDGRGHDLGVKLGNVSKEDFDKKEIRRNHFLKDKGWKRIRLISNSDMLPNEDALIILLNRIKELFQNGFNWCHVDLDKSYLTCNNHIEIIHLGNLKKIDDLQLEDLIKIGG